MRVLFLTHRLPYAPNRGDRIRAFFLLETLARIAAVDVVSLVHDDDEAGRVNELKNAASVRVARVHRARTLARNPTALFSSRPLTHVLLDSPDLGPLLHETVAAHPPHVVLAYCSGMARLVFDTPLDRIPFVLDMVDVDSAKWQALGRSGSVALRPVYRREARVLRRFEARAAAAAFATTVVTDREAETLRAIAPGASISVVGNGVDVASLAPSGPPSGERTVVFCGVMNYPPNVEAARLLSRAIWPGVRRTFPDATLMLVGSSPTKEVQAMHAPAQGIVVTGAVPDVRPYLWRAAVAAAPLFTARGIQNKVLEAVAAGLPTVVTPNLMESLPPPVARACVSAPDVQGLTDAIVSLLAKTPEERRAMTMQADLSALTWERQLEPFATIIEAAAASRRSQL